MYKKPNNYKNINSSQSKKKTEKKAELTESQMKKLKEHSKSHKGGMKSKHILNMIKNMKNGDSFSVAHKKAMKMDKK